MVVIKLWNKYKYWLISLSALTWMTVFDSNNFVDLILVGGVVGERGGIKSDDGGTGNLVERR